MLMLGYDYEQVTFKMPGPMRHWQVMCVCGGDTSTCNNGWMRELDEKMDAVAHRLMRLPPEEEWPFRVSEEDQKTIATWAIMKVMVVNHDMVHHMQRKQMKAKVEPPDGWGVWIGSYRRGGKWAAEWASRPFPVLRDDILARRRSKIAKANSHATTIVLQNLFIHVVYCRDRRLVTKWRFSNAAGGPLAGHLFRIWPPLGCSLKWPSRTLTDQAAAVVTDSILNGVMTAARRLGLLAATVPAVTQL